MKNNLFSLRGIVFCCALLLAACTKKENANEGEITYKLEPSNLTASVGANVSESGLLVSFNSNSSLTWKAGYITIGQISFEAKKQDLEALYRLTKTATVDLFKLSQEFGSIEIKDGNYENIKLKVVLHKQITGSVFALSGVYTDELGKQTPVQFNFNEDLTLELPSENLTVSSSADYTGLLILQLNNLLSGVSSSDFKAATKNVNGELLISSSSNADLFNKIKASFASLAKAEFRP